MTDIQKLLQQRDALDEKLVMIEKQVFVLEGKYLEDTQHVGNIIMYERKNGSVVMIRKGCLLEELSWRENAKKRNFVERRTGAESDELTSFK
jgi:hypothetical protein